MENVVDIQSLVEQGGTDILTEEEAQILAQQEQQAMLAEHYANLAESLSQDKLDKIASDLIDLVEQDDLTRADWYKRVKTGMKYLGVTEDKVGGADFEGASKVVHPILMDAITQFQSRAIQEVWPSKGPVNTQVLGTQTQARLEQAERVKGYMNYLYMNVMTEAFTEEDNMLLRLPISGSCFKKMYFDPLKKRLCSTFVEPADFIVSYSATDLYTCPRYTHRIREYQNDVKKKEISGYYVTLENTDSYNEDTDKPDIIEVIDDADGKTRVTSADADEDRATMYEVYVDWNLEDSDVKQPYIITIDRDMQKIRRIQRNWKPDDEKLTKRVYFAHYKFTPGLGFYGYGFLHLIGDMAISATGALRSLLDSAAFSNMQGGFRSRDSRLPGGDKPIAPGEWREVNSTAEELAKGFFNLPYKEPSATLFNLLGYLDEKATQLVGNTDVVSGESNPKDAPVGTTSMLLEQGLKVFTSIHKRLHEAHKCEFKIMAELIYEYMPDEGYPYLIGEQEATLLPSDFDERIDVIPVSDPNLASTAQRVAKAQSILELRQQFPQTISERAACKRMLMALDVDGIDELIGTDEEYQQGQQMQQQQMQAEQQHAEKVRALELEKLQAEIEDIRNKTVGSRIDSQQKALDCAIKVLQGVPAADPVPVPMSERVEAQPAVPATENSPGKPAVEGKEPEPIPTMPPVADSTQLSATADAILIAAGFEDDVPNQLAPAPMPQQQQPPQQLQGVMDPVDPMQQMY